VLAALNVGTDIALANGMAHVIVAAGLENRAFIARATEGFEAWRDTRLTPTLERVAASRASTRDDRRVARTTPAPIAR
jgi:anaerobic selenocysteine-containing dehydrogenase